MARCILVDFLSLMKLSPFQMMKRKEGRRRETLVLLVLKAQKERERVD